MSIERLRASLEGRYAIERELGEGGMATVYLAEDLKHKRKVAIKLLKPELAAVLGADRFVQEITTTAALQHPHILPLFDSGVARLSHPERGEGPLDVLYYVMPYIQGETLRDKLNRETQLGINEAIRIATEIADALHYAHTQGVVHRDIKPENILLANGRPMVADFGIALAVSAAAGGRMTETGLSLGTPHYMSPEQATAEKEITARSDVYSLGSMLYEMLSGEPPHLGGSAQQIIMKIIAEEAQPLTALRKSVPANVAAAVAKSLEKLPADRFESAAEFAAALADPGFTTATMAGAGAAGAGGGMPRSAFLAMAGMSAVLLGAALWGWLRPAEVPPTTRQEVVLWNHPLDRFTSPGIERYATQAAIAPDGSSIVFTDSVGNSVQLFRKLRDQERPTPLAGGEEGMSPFFSPDGRWIGFITLTGQLRKIPVEGGTPITLSSQAVAGYPTGAWLENDRIVFIGDAAGDGLRIISATPGDTAASVTGSVTGGRSQNIMALPGSRGVLYTTCPGNCTVGSSVYVFDFEADSAHELISDAAGAWYSPTGHLLYTARSGGLFAAGFDLDRLELTSGPVPVLPDVAPTAFTISPSGSVLYSVGADVGGASELVWVTRDGQATPVDSSWHGVFHYPAVSPDGRAIAVSLDEGTTQLWVWREGGTRQQLTQDGQVNWRPFWMPDGRSIAFLSNRRGGEGPDNYDVYRVPADGSAPPELLLRHLFGLWEVEFTQDESWMVIRADEAGVGRIRGRRTTGDTTLVPLVVREVETSNQLSLSPDGNWIAYVLVIDGVRNVYVSPFPSIASLRLVSRGEATEPRWSRSGRELFFKSSNQFMKVDVGPGPGLSLGTPRPLFPLTGYAGARNRPEYDVAPGDDRFLMIRFLETAEAESRTIYVENWFEELLAKVQP